MRQFNLGVLVLVAFMAGFTLLVRAQDAPSTTSPSKHAVPDAAGQAAANKAVRAVHVTDADAVKSPADKEKLAKKLLEHATRADDINERYALLEWARSSAIEGGGLATAMEAVATEAREFEIDAMGLRTQTMAGVCKATTSLPVARKCLARSDEMFLEAIASDRYDIARLALEACTEAAKTVGEPESSVLIIRRGVQLHECETGFAALKASLATLREKPEDPDANTAVGKFRCLIQTRWDAGLPMLAKGSDAKFKALAEKDISVRNVLAKKSNNSMAFSKEAEDMIAVADGWFSLSETVDGAGKESCRERAREWYDRSLARMKAFPPKAAEHLRALRPVKPGVVVIEAMVSEQMAVVVNKSGLSFAILTHTKADPSRPTPSAAAPVYVDGKPWSPKWSDKIIKVGNRAEDCHLLVTDSLPILGGETHVEFVVDTMGSTRDDQCAKYVSAPGDIFDLGDAVKFVTPGLPAFKWITLEIRVKPTRQAGPWKDLAGIWNIEIESGGPGGGKIRIDDQGEVYDPNGIRRGIVETKNDATFINAGESQLGKTRLCVVKSVASDKINVDLFMPSNSDKPVKAVLVPHKADW